MGKNGIRSQTYAFQKVSTAIMIGGFTEVMKKECAKRGMAPVCDYPVYCDEYSLYLGQSKHLAYPPHRKAKYVPVGFETIADKWVGTCGYTGKYGGGKALCNYPVKTHTWQGLSANTNTFICGKSLTPKPAKIKSTTTTSTSTST